MLSFIEYLKESSNPFNDHAIKAGLKPAPFPHVNTTSSNPDGMHHLFIDKVGTCWHARSHLIGGEALAKTLPDKAKPKDKYPSMQTTLKHSMKHHGLVAVSVSGGYISMKSHREPTAAQVRTIKTGVVQGKFDRIRHEQHGDDYNYASSALVRHPDFHSVVAGTAPPDDL